MSAPRHRAIGPASSPAPLERAVSICRALNPLSSPNRLRVGSVLVAGTIGALAASTSPTSTQFMDAARVDADTTALVVPAAQVIAQRVDTDGAGAYWPRLQLACPEGTSAQYRYRDRLLDDSDPWHGWRAWASVDAGGWTRGDAGTAIDVVGRQAEGQYQTRCVVQAWQGTTTDTDPITITRAV